jgi:hypothetical protein
VSLLFGGVLIEFLLHAVAGDASSGDGVHCVSQHTDDLGRENSLQDLDRLFYVGP